MGTYDGPEIFELVGIFMLSSLNKKFSSNNIGLYGHGGLSVFRNISGKQAEKQRQRLTSDRKMQSENGWLFRCNMKFE